MLLLLVSLAAVLLVPAGCEQLSCVCARDQAGGALHLSCLKSDGENVTCTEDSTIFENVVDSSLAAVDTQPSPASHVVKRWASRSDCQQDRASALAGYTYVEDIGLVRLFRVHTRHADAKQRCQKEGGRLVNHYGWDEIKALASLFPKDSSVTSAYTGITSNASDLPWAKGEPSRRRGEDCVLVDKRGRLRSARCDHLEAFICERPSRAPRGYSWVPAAGSFLKVDKDRKTYSDAQEACKRDGATLAVPDTWQRAEAMIDYASQSSHQFYVGFTYKFVGSDYITPSGSLMSSMEFSNWDTADHVNQNRLKFNGCVTLHSEGYYEDVDCHKKHNYLCELKL